MQSKLGTPHKHQINRRRACQRATLHSVKRGDEPVTNMEFARLLERAKGIRMSSGDREQQRRSFAYGNANIENEAVTRGVIDEVAERMAKEPDLDDLISESDGGKKR